MSFVETTKTIITLVMSLEMENFDLNHEASQLPSAHFEGRYKKHLTI